MKLGTRSAVFAIAVVAGATTSVGRVQAQSGDVYGPHMGARWISATKFVDGSGASPPLLHEDLGFYKNPSSATPQRYLAHVDDLPNGALVHYFWCLVVDNSATNDVLLQYLRATQSIPVGPAGGARSLDVLATTQSVGAQSWPREYVATFPTPEPYRTIPAPGQYTQHLLSADLAADTSLAGCLVGYKLQISPAPVVASFTDVPPDHPFFRVIEALKAAGITSGCTATEYCPDAPLTRAAVAAFLARALGLYFPY